MAAIDPFHATLLMDSIHDFLKARGAGPLTNLNRHLEAVVTTRTPTYLELYRRIAADPSQSEDKAAELLNAFPPTFQVRCRESPDPAINLANLNSVFSVFGPQYQIINNVDAPLIHLICDGGPMHLGTIAKNINHYINIVHTVTPATACDSAGIKRGIAFGKPVIFEDGNGIGGEQLLSRSAIFSGCNYSETSNVFDINSNINAAIHISGAGAVRPGVVVPPGVVPEYKIPINTSGRGPSITMLNKAIASGTAGPYLLNRFSNELLFDIKRCGDSDQVGHAHSLLQRNQNTQNVYVFATLDRICAYIAAKYYQIPTIFQSNSGSEKIFTIWNPGAPPMVVVPQGGQTEEGENRMTGPEFLEFITSLCADKVRSKISSLSLDVAGYCSYHALTPYLAGFKPIQRQLLNEYVEKHNILYSRIGWQINGPLAAAQENIIASLARVKQNLNYSVFLDMPGVQDYLRESATQVIEEISEAYDAPTLAIIRSNYTLDLACDKLVRDPVIGMLTLALLGDIIQSPSDPSVSVVTMLLFNDFLPTFRNIPNMGDWSANAQDIYSQLITVFHQKITSRSQLRGDREVIRLIGGTRRRKTFRRKHNGRSVRKTTVGRNGSASRTHRKVRAHTRKRT